ncbi:MAG TPA: heavy metal-associated domain-containing protein [Rhizomicrobium sp.]|jgi:copper chaperone CopZ
MQGSNNHDSEALTQSISGMTCAGCANTVTRVLSRVPGVASAEFDFASGRAVVRGQAQADTLTAAVEAAGFGARLSQQ